MHYNDKTFSLLKLLTSTLFYKTATWDTVQLSNNLERSDNRCRGSAYWERPNMKNLTSHCPAAQTDDERKKLLSSNFALAFQIRFKWHSALVVDSKHLLIILCPFISVTYVSPESETEWRDEYGGLGNWMCSNKQVRIWGCVGICWRIK